MNKLLQVKGQETRKCFFILFLTFLVKKVQKWPFIHLFQAFQEVEIRKINCSTKKTGIDNENVVWANSLLSKKVQNKTVNETFSSHERQEKYCIMHLLLSAICGKKMKNTFDSSSAKHSCFKWQLKTSCGLTICSCNFKYS